MYKRKINAHLKKCSEKKVIPYLLLLLLRLVLRLGVVPLLGKHVTDPVDKLC